jgi:PAS domain S-box-containing protein
MEDVLEVLLVAESDDDASWIARFLRETGVNARCERARDACDVLHRLADAPPDVCIARVTNGCADAALSAFDEVSIDGPPLLLLADGFAATFGVAERSGALVCVPGLGIEGLVVAIRHVAREASARRRRRQERSFELGQREVLELIARGTALEEVLEQLVRLVERQAEGMLCSILRLDLERARVLHGAAPSLPDAFNRAIHGQHIGPNAGSCGAAAYRRARVVIEDIATHPNWEPYREFALPHGLRACWSTPIFSGDGAVLGTFAMYYREPRGPLPQEEAWVEHATHVASIALSRERDEIERRRLSEAMRQSEHLRAMAYDGVTDVLFYIRVEPDGGFVFHSVNAAFLAATGLRQSDVVGRRVEDVVPPSSIGVVLSHYRQAIAERRTITWDDVAVYPAGKKYGEIAITPVFDAGGSCTHLLGLVHDVTDRRQADERIRAQAALLDRATDAIMVRSVDGVLTYWNQGAERLYGWTREEVLGRNVADFLYRDPSSMRAAGLELAARGEWSGELLHRTRDGRILTVQARWTLLREEGGGEPSVLVINTDITEKRSLEAQVLRAQRLESLGRLAGGIAHDFNNILTAIKGNVSLALGDLVEDHPARDALLGIELAGMRAADLVRQILTFSRHEEPKRRRMPLYPIVLDALSLLRVTLPSTIRVETRFAPDVPEISGDPGQVHQVLMNLGTNAAQAMGESGGVLGLVAERVKLDSRVVAGATEIAPGEYARLTISDTGHGMDPATLERIFDPFFTTKEPGQGTGLGLSVAHGIVRSHGGGIVVKSAPSEGASFSLYFPAATS